MTQSLGPLVHSYFIDHLPVQKGLRLDSELSRHDPLVPVLRVRAAPQLDLSVDPS